MLGGRGLRQTWAFSHRHISDRRRREQSADDAEAKQWAALGFWRVFSGVRVAFVGWHGNFLRLMTDASQPKGPEGRSITRACDGPDTTWRKWARSAPNALAHRLWMHKVRTNSFGFWRGTTSGSGPSRSRAGAKRGWGRAGRGRGPFHLPRSFRERVSLPLRKGGKNPTVPWNLRPGGRLRIDSTRAGRQYHT